MRPLTARGWSRPCWPGAPAMLVDATLVVLSLPVLARRGPGPRCRGFRRRRKRPPSRCSTRTRGRCRASPVTRETASRPPRWSEPGTPVRDCEPAEAGAPREGRDVLAALPQRRRPHREDVQPVVQVFPELAVRDERGQIPVRRRDDACVDVVRPVVPPLEQLRRDGGDVHRHEGACIPRTSRVDVARDQLLAHARFAHHEHRCA
jgi:hypothetical protein